MKATEFARYQFGIRHLLVVTVVAAALAAVMGPFMREWTVSQWAWYSAHLVVAAVAFLVTLVRRFRAEDDRATLLGKVRWQVPLAWEIQSPLPWWGRIVIAVVLLGGIVAVLEGLSFLAIGENVTGLWTVLCGIAMGLLAGGGVFDEAMLPAQAAIGDNGLLIATTFFPWKSLSRDELRLENPVKLAWPDRQVKCTLHFPPESEVEIIKFLQSRLSAGAGPFANDASHRRLD